MTSKLGRSNNQSNREQGEAAHGSVYDFLYHDARRIASFLSQFDNFGHLTGITRSEAAQKSRDKGGAAKAEASMLTLAKASGEVTHEIHAQYEQASHRAYDPLWANALTFLDYLQERKLLQRNLSSARIGQIVLFSGELSLFDLGLLRKMWDLPTVKKAIINGATNEANGVAGQALPNRKERRQSGNNKDGKPPTEAEIAVELMTVLPHMVQVSVSGETESVWACLRDDSTVGSPSELMMKHGLTIDGTWNIVGILDALPDHEDYFPQDGSPPLSMMRQMLAGSKLGFLAFTMAGSLVPPIREMLGRPKDSFGLTPLLLFREISESADGIE